MNVKAIRKRLGLTQTEFCKRFDLTVATLRDWEQGRKTPNAIACNYLRLIAIAPDHVEFGLGKLRNPPVKGVVIANETFLSETT